MTTSTETVVRVEPETFPAPRGYANGIIASGPIFFVAGQIAWDREQRIVSDELSEQFGQALDNVLTVVRAGGGEVRDIVRMTVYVTDMAGYRSGRERLKRVWRERMGRHYPTMALVGVTELVEIAAKVEIEATCVLAKPEQR